MKRPTSSAGASADQKPSSSAGGERKLPYNSLVDVTRHRTQVWIAQLPQDLYKAWMDAKGETELGSIEIIKPPKIGCQSTASTEMKDEEEQEEEDNSGTGRIVVYDKNHSAATYHVDLLPTPEENSSFILSENSGNVRFALEGRVDLKALVYPSQDKKKDKKDKKKKKKEKEEDLIVDFDPETHKQSSDMLKTVHLDDEVEKAPKTERRIRGDKELVKDELFRLMQNKPMWSKRELVEALAQPQSMVDELLTEWCERVETESVESGFRRTKVLFQLKGFLRSSSVSSDSVYQPPLKKSAP